MMAVEATIGLHRESAPPDMPVNCLGGRFVTSGFTGFPVVRDGNRVGIVRAVADGRFAEGRA